jgi:formiminoglutamate deiminase
MGHALVRSARTAGIRIALLDAGYFSAGFDQRQLHPVQTRFRDASAADWLNRVEALRAAHADISDVIIGLAPHSVRAVPEAALVELARRHRPGTPIHIHVSEQPEENRECLQATTLTPTRLLDRVGLLGPDTTLVHATHLTADDVTAINASGSTVCYCATTERDLGDGIGPASDLDRGGTMLCVGTDSHAVIDVFEEMRGIELHTRLASGRRGSFAPHRLLAAGSANGATSLGLPGRGLTAGSPADFVVVDTSSPRLTGWDLDTAVDSIVFAAQAGDVTDVFVAGRRIVSDGTHSGWEEAQRVLRELAANP